MKSCTRQVPYMRHQRCINVHQHCMHVHQTQQSCVSFLLIYIAKVEKCDNPWHSSLLQEGHPYYRRCWASWRVLQALHVGFFFFSPSPPQLIILIQSEWHKASIHIFHRQWFNTSDPQLQVSLLDFAIVQICSSFWDSLILHRFSLRQISWFMRIGRSHTQGLTAQKLGAKRKVSSRLKYCD